MSKERNAREKHAIRIITLLIRVSVVVVLAIAVTCLTLLVLSNCGVVPLADSVKVALIYALLACGGMLEGELIVITRWMNKWPKDTKD